MNTHQIINQEWATEEITPIDSYCPIVVQGIGVTTIEILGTIGKNNEYTADNKIRNGKEI